MMGLHSTFVLSLLYLSSVHAAPFSYAPIDNPNLACILLDIDYEVTFTLVKDGMEVKKVKLTDQDEGITVVGKCTDIDKRDIGVKYPDKTMVYFLFSRDAKGDVTMKLDVRLTPNKLFPNNELPTNVSNYVSKKRMLSNDNSSYVCLERREFDLDLKPERQASFVINVTIAQSNIKAQAFNIEDSEFSSAEFCKEDNNRTTTSFPTSPTTSAPQNATTPALPATNRYVVMGNGSAPCVVLVGAMDLLIRYRDKEDRYRTAEFEIPSNAMATGDCSDQLKQILNIKFNGWTLGFTFSDSRLNNEIDKKIKLYKYNNDSKNRTVSKYRISNITLTYVVSKINFKDTADTDGTIKVAAPSEGEADFPGTSGQTSYRCDSLVTLNVDDDVRLTTRFLQFKAFNTDDTTDFEEPASTCLRDEPPSSTEPILVGCLVAGLLGAAVVVMGWRQWRGRGAYTVMP